MEGSVGPKRDKKAEIKNRLHGMFSPRMADSVYTIIDSMPPLTKKIVIFILNLTANQIITVVLGFLFANTAFTSVVLVFYAMSNGLPAFEALEAVGTNYLVFTVVIMFFTLLLIAILLSQGLLWITDETVRDLSWFNEQEFGNKSYWVHLRWSISFLPGILFSAIACSWLSMNDEKHLNVIFGKFLMISVLFIVSVHCVSGYILLRSGRMGRPQNRARPKFLKFREISRNLRLHLLIMTNLLSSMFFVIHILVFSQTLADFVKIDKSRLLEFLKGETNFSVALIAFIVSLASVSLTYITTMWVVRINLWKALFAVLFAFAFVVLFRPGIVTLLQKYMAVMKIGGGTPIIVSLDREMSKVWPELFEKSPNSLVDSTTKYVQSGRLSLILLGKNKMYVKTNSVEDIGMKGTFMLHDSRYKEILFLEEGKTTK